MQTAKTIDLKSSLSVWDVEDALSVAAQRPKDSPLTVQLARRTDARLLADLAVTRFIATVASRSGPLTIRDWGSGWNESATRERFLTRIDGVAALINATAHHRLENTEYVCAPASLLQELHDRVLATSNLESAAPTMSRTYVAIDPEISVPIELNTLSDDGRVAFQREIAAILQQFGSVNTSLLQHREESSLYEAVYEIFQNSYEHGRVRGSGENAHGLRYLRFRTHTQNKPGELVERSSDFPALQAYFDRRSGPRSSKRFLEISIGDDGLGIGGHYLHSTGDDVDAKVDVMLLNKLLTESLSSKKIPGCGLGLPKALRALDGLKAFVALRTADQWLYRDYSDEPRGPEERVLLPVTDTQLAHTVGTHFTMLCDFATN